MIDSTKVVRSALQYAASVAGMMITTEAAVADKPEKKLLQVVVMAMATATGMILMMNTKLTNCLSDS